MHVVIDTPLVALNYRVREHYFFLFRSKLRTRARLSVFKRAKHFKVGVAPTFVHRNFCFSLRFVSFFLAARIRFIHNQMKNRNKLKKIRSKHIGGGTQLAPAAVATAAASATAASSARKFIVYENNFIQSL